MATVFLSILNQMEFNLVQNRKENCHHDHIPFSEKYSFLSVGNSLADGKKISELVYTFLRSFSLSFNLYGNRVVNIDEINFLKKNIRKSRFENQEKHK